ncbi:hypothetical protein BDK51DRAFT_27514 [Blyttiomyces helicus]|uniref:KxDL domain-containing protein n=1 Tax=Blyttiomyces helicus TaxID=388810 RepID=A0A4P9WNL3_9FUNG|nr:hypothetical protein BDK51DRAFT_27514 [Blyttiomyces helicus]|eukprot:RKO92356.1 hypothetical protein BDK51DRAFT_27514 [Blyttiomyces helicus]
MDPSPTPSRMREASGATALARRLVDSVSEEDLNAVLEQQQKTKELVTKTTRQLEMFNTFSASRFAENQKRLEEAVGTLRDMKADLDVVFRRIRLVFGVLLGGDVGGGALKTKVATLHPTEYAIVTKSEEPADEEDD